MPSRPDGGDGAAGAGRLPPSGALEKALKAFSLITMALTVPQVLAVWHGHAQGVSAVSWSAYLASACLWMVHGVRVQDRSIYLPCIGWIVLDALIVVGALVH